MILNLQHPPFAVFQYGWKLFRENPPARLGEVHDAFMEGIESSLANAKLFEVEDSIKNLLLLTKAPKAELKLPFEDIFLDVQFSPHEMKGEYQIIGLLIRKGKLLERGTDEEVNQDSIRISFMLYNGESIYFNTMNDAVKGRQVVVDGDKKKEEQVLFQKILNSKTEKLLGDFVHNFITFINSPDVQVVTVERGEKNQLRRQRQGKEILPPSQKVIINHRIREYLDQLKSNGHVDFTHRFWVRGFWRTLRSEKRYGNNAGKRLWVMPFIKGKGILIEKKYEVKA